MMINIQKNIDREKINFDYLVLHDRHEDLEDVVIKMGSQKLIASADEISNKWHRGLFDGIDYTGFLKTMT